MEMTLQTIIQQVKQEYSNKSIAKTRYSALNKIIDFLHLLEKENDHITAVYFIKGINKNQFKELFLRYKIRHLHLSDKLSGAENQAINDLYRETGETSSPITIPEIKLKSNNPTITKNSPMHKIKHTDYDLKTGLPPMVGEDPKILILGTMPSDISIQKQAYYSNDSKNKFREIVYSIYQQDADLSCEVLLMKHHIALWDCIKRGKRKGSVDKGFDTNSLIPNDIEEFLKRYPTIRVIILNGKSKSRKSTFSIFNKFFPDLGNRYKVIALDSTSNANATVPTEVKVKRWAIIKDLEEE